MLPAAALQLVLPPSSPPRALSAAAGRPPPTARTKQQQAAGRHAAAIKPTTSSLHHSCRIIIKACMHGAPNSIPRQPYPDLPACLRAACCRCKPIARPPPGRPALQFSLSSFLVPSLLPRTVYTGKQIHISKSSDHGEIW